MDHLVEPEHRSVLLKEVLDWLRPKKGGFYLDGTIGLAGHSIGLLKASKGWIEILGLDRDIEILELARKRLREKGWEKKVYLVNESFSHFDEILEELGQKLLDGALLDLGISSFQLDRPERGFSFHQNGELDMRMNQSSQEKTAKDIVNHSSYKELKEIVRVLGQDPLAGRIAKAILEQREKKEIRTTNELSEIVAKAYPTKMRRKSKRHPATRTFQALRMEVNNELKELESFLNKVLDYLRPGARLCVISFHSLEDGLVKHFFKQEARDCICPPEQMYCNCRHKARLRILTKKPVVPGKNEILENRRSRSAKLRVAEAV